MIKQMQVGWRAQGDGKCAATGTVCRLAGRKQTKGQIKCKAERNSNRKLLFLIHIDNKAETNTEKLTTTD